MSGEIDVTVNLKIPSLTVRLPDVPVRRIDNQGVRFLKRVSVPALPQPGEFLDLSAEGTPIRCQVIKTQWNEGLDMFVVYCSYAERSISLSDYKALAEGLDWIGRPLIP